MKQTFATSLLFDSDDESDSGGEGDAYMSDEEGDEADHSIDESYENAECYSDGDYDEYVRRKAKKTTDIDQDES